MKFSKSARAWLVFEPGSWTTPVAFDSTLLRQALSAPGQSAGSSSFRPSRASDWSTLTGWVGEYHRARGVRIYSNEENEVLG